jgi:hypothetical protein
MGRYQFHEPTLLNKLWLYGVCALLVAVIWAIIYHREIQAKRVSLRFLFVLVLLEAIDFAAIKFFRGW